MTEKGSLAYYRCIIRRTNVNGAVKGKFKQHEVHNIHYT